MLTGRVPDGTIAIDEWKRTGCFVRNEPGFSRQASESSTPAVGELKRRKRTHFSMIWSTSPARPLSCVGGGMDPEANTASSGHSYSVNASSSVPNSQL